MSVSRRLLLGAAVTAGVGGAVQGARAAAMRRRISWSPGGGATHDGALHARTLGDGTAGVVLLHGLGGSNVYWGSAYDTLVSAGRLVVPDLLGFGDSPNPPSGYTTEDHVAALVGLLDELGVTGPVVVGAHSLGSLVAIALADRRPDLVAGVVAFCPPLYPDEATARDRISSLGLLERQLATDSPWAKTDCAWVCRHRRGAALIAAAVRPGIPSPIRRDGVRHSWASYSETFRHVLASAEGGQVLARLKIPVELVAGTADGVTDLGYLRLLAGQLAHVSLTVIGGADHDLPLTDPGGAVAHLTRAARLIAPAAVVAG